MAIRSSDRYRPAASPLVRRRSAATAPIASPNTARERAQGTAASRNPSNAPCGARAGASPSRSDAVGALVADGRGRSSTEGTDLRLKRVAEVYALVVES